MKTNPKAVVHLLHGFICSGKTTFAKKLELESNTIRFTHDERMCKLYGINPPIEKFKEYYERVEILIWEMSTKLLKLDINVIIDSGFWTISSREKVIERCKKLKVEPRLYNINCSDLLRRKRLTLRHSNINE
jgi:predicted kinase